MKIKNLIFLPFLLLVISLANAEESCIDSDGGLDYWTKGRISGIDVGESFELEDNCKGNVLNEMMCEEEYSEPTIKEYECPHGCVNGACIFNDPNEESPINLEESCTDSDGGRFDYWTKGEISGIDVGEQFVSEDNCNGNTLNEYGCKEEYAEPSIQEYECPYQCEDGACVGLTISTEEPEEITEERPIDLVAKGIFKFDASKGLDNLFINLNDLTIIEGDDIKLVGLVENKGSKETNRFNTTILIDDERIKEGVIYFIRPFEEEHDLNNNFVWTATKGIHTITYNVDVYNQIAESNENNNKKSVTVTVSERDEKHCVDSDGGKDYYEEGVVRRLEETQTDSCYKYPEGMVNECDGSKCKVQEVFCGTDDKIYGEFYDCPNGCYDGECVAIEKSPFFQRMLNWFKTLFGLEV